MDYELLTIDVVSDLLSKVGIYYDKSSLIVGFFLGVADTVIFLFFLIVFSYIVVFIFRRFHKNV